MRLGSDSGGLNQIMPLGHNRIMSHLLLKGVHPVYRTVHIHTYTCVCACVFTLCNTEAIIHTVTCRVDVSSDEEAVCSLLFIASLSMFLSLKQNMTAVIKEQLLYVSTNLYIYYTDFMHVVLAYLMSLCFKMAAATQPPST